MCATTLALSILIASAAPAPSGSGLQKLLASLEQGQCEEAFLQLAQVEPPAPGAERTRAAKAVASGAQKCRSADPAIALEISSLALRLAPEDTEVALGHAESLLAADQRGDAATLLDRLVASMPASKLPRAWLLRGELAAQEADFEVAVRTLEPLEKDPALKQRVAPLLAKSREGLRAQQERMRVLSEAEKSTQARLSEGIAVARERRAEAPPSTPEAAGRSHSAGETVATFSNRLGRRGSTSFTVRGLIEGRLYRLESTGRCRREAARCKHYSRFGDCVHMGLHTAGGIFGLDFRVQLGSQPSRSLPVGSDREERARISFVADSPTMTIRVFDESSASSAEEVSCEVGGFAVIAE